jgi:hypothetical protein
MEVRERPLSTADLAATSETKPRQDKPGTTTEANKTEPLITTGHAPERPSGTGSNNAEELVQLFSDSAVQKFRLRWTTLQTDFVDEPRRSV